MGGSFRTSELRFATVFFVICFLVIGYFLYVILRPFFSILLLATILTVVFRPLFREVAKAVRGRQALASLITCLLILLLIVLPMFYLGVVITKQSMNLYQTIQTSVADDSAARFEEFQNRPYVKWALDQAGRWLHVEQLNLRTAAEQILSILSRFLVSQSPSLLKGAGELLFGFLLMFISMFFLFRDGPLMLQLLKASNPLPPAYETEIIKRFQDVCYATFFGSILTAAAQGMAGAVLFWALGIQSALFWGSIIALVSLIPIVGAFLVWVPWMSYLFLIGQTGRALVLLVVGGLVVSSLDNVLKPMIIQGRTNMHPLLVFMSVLGGMNAFGFLGIVVGPLIVALFVAFLNFYRVEFRETLKEKLVRDS
jgi:predicted PurR-regulated permease PerM